MKDTIAQRMMALFAGLARAYGIYKIDDPSAPGKKKGHGNTLQEPVTEELWELHLKGRIQLGIVPIRDDATCVFAAIDIDDYKLDHAALDVKIKKHKLPLVMCRSKSGGAHLYGFFPEGTKASSARELMSDYAALLGYGNVEIFPKQNQLFSGADTGNWINMPYCGGDKTERYCLRDNERLTIEQFLDYAPRKRITAKHYEKAEQERPELLEEGPPCLGTLCAGGFPEGTRNSGLFALGVYAKRRWPTDWEAKLSEMNDKFMSPALDNQELRQITAHLQRKEYTYQCKNPPLVSYCQRATCIKRKYGIGPADAQDIFGVPMENVMRLEVDPPKYFADFNGKRISFGSEQINSQSLMRDLIIKQANEVIQPIPSPKWFQYMAKMCAEAAIAAAPPETSRKAHMVSLAEDFCLEQVPGRSWEDIIDGQTYEVEGRVYFKPYKFTQAVNKEHHLKVTTSEAYEALMAIDIKSEKREIGGKQTTVWSLPAFKRHERKRAADSM